MAETNDQDGPVADTSFSEGRPRLRLQDTIQRRKGKSLRLHDATASGLNLTPPPPPQEMS